MVIIFLRRVCRAFADATRAKILWMDLLDTSAAKDILPSYLKTPHLLDSGALEALVLRVSRLSSKWSTGDLGTVNSSGRLHLCQSVTWIRLLSGSWLFVASSDNDGYTEPIAEAYLPGEVRTAQLEPEVQVSGVVLELDLGPKSPSVHIITLRQHSGSHHFAELCRVMGSSHVLMLHDNFVGCAARSSIVQSAPHLILGWHDFIVVIRQNALDFYTWPSSSGGLGYIKSIQTITIRLAGDVPWYHLRANGTGTRALWLTVTGMCTPHTAYPHLTFMSVFPPLAPGLQAPLIDWTNDLPDDPALWAFPALDFDKALGFTVIGNCVGELTIYDHAGSDPIECCGLGHDFTEQSSSLPALLPLHLTLRADPIPLELRVMPKPSDPRADHTMVAHWSQDDLGLDGGVWRTDWLSGIYYNWDQRQGVRGDFAGLLDHVYGFPGSLVPQAYAACPYSSDASDASVVLRAGPRCLLYSIERDDPHAPCVCPVAYTVAGLYGGLFTQEFHRQGGRNRWVEQRERGGRRTRMCSTRRP
ncbi:hypothetical protein B0H17DRAFT_1175693 [Mycena rosella]|uniref:Uncharacterized protein n=1 Tax=Mycena rosella TaxID=1033263 RepID=A0AAD7M6T6_MYCRO|nr:hypothetical protein B0H17DRAFT_1175693 [Mycena rosella]